MITISRRSPVAVILEYDANLCPKARVLREDTVNEKFEVLVLRQREVGFFFFFFVASTSPALKY